jgi:hypothetical protein
MITKAIMQKTMIKIDEFDPEVLLVAAQSLNEF